MRHLGRRPECRLKPRAMVRHVGTGLFPQPGWRCLLRAAGLGPIIAAADFSVPAEVHRGDLVGRIEASKPRTGGSFLDILSNIKTVDAAGSEEWDIATAAEKFFCRP